MNDEIQIYATEHMNSSSSSGPAAAVRGSSSVSSVHSTSGLVISPCEIHSFTEILTDMQGVCRYIA